MSGTAHRDAFLAHRRLSRVLRSRARMPGSCTKWPDWLDPTALNALSIPLERPGRVSVAVRDGVPLAAIPPSVAIGRGIWHVEATRAPRLMAQSAPEILRTLEPRDAGTATALVQDGLDLDRRYLLTCGHVVAPVAGTRANETLDIRASGGTQLSGRLAEWLPPLGEGAYRTNLDAGLVEISRTDASVLLQDDRNLPAGLAGQPRRDDPVTLRRRGEPTQGWLKVHWSGWVELPNLTPGVADYFLEDAIGYTTGEPTVGGDSGAAVWNADDGLLGMHIGGISGAPPGEANAVYGPIKPVLDWFHVQPYMRGGAPPVDPDPRPPGRTTPNVLPEYLREDDYEISVVARTLWGEARGEGAAGMQAVASVIRNRLDLHWQGKFTPAEICLSPRQFSCWNPGDPNLARMERVMREPDAAYESACRIARDMLQGRLADSTNGATHYVASTLRPRPVWLQGKTPIAVIGNHEFFKGIA